MALVIGVPVGNTQELQGRNGNETVVSQMVILWFQSVKYVSMKSMSFGVLEASHEGHFEWCRRDRR